MSGSAAGDGASLSGSKRRRPDDDAASSAAAPAPASSASAASPHVPSWHGCRSVTAYRPLRKIDEGTYGVVFAAEDVVTGDVVALKKVKMQGAAVAAEGFPITALRETNVLLALRHPNIIRVREMVVGGDLDKVYMVMDYMSRDVKVAMGLLGQPFTQAEVKCLMAQLLAGVAHMHGAWVIHRDLKTSNLLLGAGGRLAICDFGLARKYGSPLRPYTETVVTQWYRAPELLLGARTYATAVDVWSCGCILAELVLGKPLFAGRSEPEQLELIFKLLGTPTDAAWPGWDRLPLARELRMRPRAPASLRAALGLDAAAPYGAGAAAHMSEAGLDLLRGLLMLDPARRISAADALAHPWFAESPLPLDPRLLPSFPDATDAARDTADAARGAAAAAGSAAAR